MSTLIEDVVGREEVQVVRFAMAEVKAGECRAAGQEEPLLPAEEALEDLLLKAAKPANGQGDRRPARERKGTPRTDASDPAGQRPGATTGRPPEAT